MTTLDVAKLFEALDAKRKQLTCQRCNDVPSWRAIARELGMPQSTFTRISRQKGLAADTLVTLLGWLGETDLAPYLCAGSLPVAEAKEAD